MIEPAARGGGGLGVSPMTQSRLFNRLLSSARRFGRGRAKPVAPRTQVRGLTLDRLEERTLLSADLGASGAWIRWGAHEVPVEAGSFVVTFDDYMGNAQAELLAREVATRLGVTGTDFSSLGRGGWATFKTGNFVSQEMAQRVAAAVPGVSAVEPNLLRKPMAVSNDPRLADQWNLINTGQLVPDGGNGVIGTPGADISAQEAWDISVGSRSVVVAIIDTGIDLTHADLVRNIWVNPGEVAGNGVDDDNNGFVDDVNGYNFAGNSGNVQDEDGHGTAVAGVIGADGNNGQGMAGVNWAVSMMSLKVSATQGNNTTLSTSAIIAAHDYITMMRNDGVNVVVSNGSYGDVDPGAYNAFPDGIAGELAAIQRWQTAGGIFVASAGNFGVDLDNDAQGSFPASYDVPSMIVVAASDPNDGLFAGSNFGAASVDLAAPGYGLTTTSIGGGYTQLFFGTSASAAMVTGAVALLKAIQPSASATQVKAALIDSVDISAAMQGRVVAGGRMNLARAMQIIGIDGPSVRSFDPGPVTTQLDPNTNTVINTITVNFNEAIDNNSAFFQASGVTVTGLGTDNILGTGDDFTVPVTALTRTTGNTSQAVAGLNLGAFSGQRLPLGRYHVVLDDAAFRDLDGNFLNGNGASGSDQTYDFRVVAASGDNEPNDTFAQATAVSFNSSGQANFTGATIGNGLFANLDVDIYKVTLSRGGLITADVVAQRRGIGSTLDAYVRLFNSRGDELAFNDQFFGSDPYIDFFVSTGGDYYVAVSGFGNENYNPAVAGSGATQSLGGYDLNLNVQLVQDEIVTANAPTGQVPRRIPIAETQTQGTTTSFLNVTDSRQIRDVNVRLDISHTFVGDLRISLFSPTNVEVRLFTNRGSNGQNLTATIFDDEASTAIGAASAPFTGSFRPEASLGAFDGIAANGTWTLLVQDTGALNAGVLNSWSIDFTFTNDVFGPFEFNDTISTAKVMAEINGSGTATRQAFIGDGAFGSRDRDIFSFTADAGTTLTATLTSGGTLNGAMRLFDASGTQVIISAPGTSNNAQFDNYTFSSGGVYYIAISENANQTYDPLSSGGGTAATTTGAYTLNLTISAGVSDPAVTLTGTSVATTVGTSGNFAGIDANGNQVGLRFNGLDFLAPGNGRVPQQFIGASVNGSSFVNEGQGGSIALPMTLTSRSDANNRVVAANGRFLGLSIDRVISFGVSDSFIAIDMVFTNTTPSALNSIAWMEGFNPDPGIADQTTQLTTFNDVEGAGAYARYNSNSFQQGLTIGLVAPDADTRAKAAVVANTTQIRNPSQLVGGLPIDPDGASSNGQLALSFDIGTLASGASTRVRYFVLMGNSPASVDALADAMNNNTGSGHLVANVTTPSGQVVVSTNNPAAETLSTGSGPVITAPTLPYKVYYPEGFSGPGITTILRLANPTNQSNRIVAIARFETGVRDQILADVTLAANARTAVTLLTPDTFLAQTSVLTRDRVPYSVEIRAENTVSASFEHNDSNLTGGSTSSMGEAFTSRVSNTWSFGELTKGSGVSDFLSFYNTTGTFTKVTTTLFPAGGGATTVVTFNLPAFSRGGLSIGDLNIAEGTYGAIVQADVGIVAAASSYKSAERTAEGVIGVVGGGSAQGVNPEGQFGLNATAEQVAVLNSSGVAASVIFSFQLANGSSYRTSLAVPANSYRRLDVSTLANFPTGQAYSIFYESNVPVTVSAPTQAFGGELWGSFADTAFTLWNVGSGFRPAGTNQTQVTEYLRIHNPSNSETVVEITIDYGGTNGSETFRRTIGSRRVAEFDIGDFITGARRDVDSFYSLQVKSGKPVVVYSARIDRDAGLSYGSLATPLGLAGPVAEPV